MTHLERWVGGYGRTSSPALKPCGGQLREWNGPTHVVELTETGYCWNREAYPSLSAVAGRMTSGAGSETAEKVRFGHRPRLRCRPALLKDLDLTPSRRLFPHPPIE